MITREAVASQLRDYLQHRLKELKSLDPPQPFEDLVRIGPSQAHQLRQQLMEPAVADEGSAGQRRVSGGSVFLAFAREIS